MAKPLEKNEAFSAGEKAAVTAPLDKPFGLSVSAKPNPVVISKFIGGILLHFAPNHRTIARVSSIGKHNLGRPCFDEVAFSRG